MDPGNQEKGVSAWTDEAKFQFLLRIVAQLKEDGRGIKWEKINIPGRTPKSLKNMWTKINKQINDFEAQENSGEGSVMATPVKPRKRGPPGKKGLAIQGGEGLDDEDLDIKQKLLKKRAAEVFEGENLGVDKKRAKIKAEATTDGAVRVKKEAK